jgi:LysR family transcriptional activator of nhaA
MVRIGIVKSVPKLVTYALLQPAFESAYGVRVEEASLSVLLERLQLHHLDIVVSDFPLAPNVASGAYDHPLGRSRVHVYGTPELIARHLPFPGGLDGAPFLLLTKTALLRRVLDRSLDAIDARPRVVAEFDDSALLKVVAAEGKGFIAAPEQIEAHLEAVYGLKRAYALPDAYEELHLLSMERHVQHPVAATIFARGRQLLEGISSMGPG